VQQLAAIRDVGLERPRDDPTRHRLNQESKSS